MNPVETPPSAPEYCPYPGFGDPDDIHARILLLEWICSQIGVTVDAKPGQYVLGTEGRILGVGDDSTELHNRVLAAEPELASARRVAYRVPDEHW